MKSKKTNSKAFGGTKFAVLNFTTQVDFSEEKNLHNLTYDYIPFGDNVANDLPQHLAMLRRKSATHRAILSQKVAFTTGGGFLSEDEKVLDYLSSCNAKEEDFRDVLRKLFTDYYTIGNAYMEIVHYKGGVALYHIDATTVRISKDKENVIIHPNWDDYIQYKDQSVLIPFYPNFIQSEGGKRSVIHLKDYEPEFTNYGMPDYIAVLESISVDYEIGRWNNTKFKNHFQPSSIVEINGDMSDDEAERLVEEAKAKFTGEGNNGKILFLVKNGDSSPATVTNIQDTSEGNFLALQETTNQNIITAHRWQPALSGVVSSGKMSSQGNEIRIAYEMVMNTVIGPTISTIFNPIKKILADNGFNVDTLEIKQEPPISYMSDVKIENVLEINELRAIIGYEQKDGYDKLTNQKEVEDEELVDENIEEEELEKEEEVEEVEQTEIEKELIKEK
jgi:phage portal protein BeeE